MTHNAQTRARANELRRTTNDVSTGDALIDFVGAHANSTDDSDSSFVLVFC